MFLGVEIPGFVPGDLGFKGLAPQHGLEFRRVSFK